MAMKAPMQMKLQDLLSRRRAAALGLPGTGRVGISACDIATGVTAQDSRGWATRNHGCGLNRVSPFDLYRRRMAVPLLLFDHTGAAPENVTSTWSIAPYGALRRRTAR
jgi:hypothetical protein